MSESDNVQRVRVVDAWAVKTAKGEYLDAYAVNFINGTVITLLILLTLFWVGVVYVQARTLVFIHGTDVIHWEPSTLGSILVVVFNFLAAIAHLAGISLIVRHNANTALIIQLFCALIGVSGILQVSGAVAYGALTVPVYLVIGALIGIVRPYFRR